MKLQKIDKALAADLSGNDMIIVYDAGSEIYFMGSIMTNRSMSLDEALNLIGWDEETMDEMTEALGWDGWDYDEITDVWNPAEYLSKIEIR